MARGPQPPPSTGADLAALLGTEQRLERVLALARAEAEQLRADARARAARAEADGAAALVHATAEVAAAIERDTATRIATLEAEADREGGGWDALQGAALERAVAAVLVGLRARLGASA